MKIEDRLLNIKNKIDPLIKKYLEEKIRYYQKFFPESAVLINQIINLTLRGGDRVRPALFYYGFKLIRQPNTVEEQELLRLSTAFEIFHSFALIHDDIIDGSYLRRAGITVNQYFTGRFGSGWGDRLAILAGDLAEIFSQEIFQSHLFQKTAEFSKRLFIRMKEEVILGEYMDSIMPLLPKLPIEEMVIKILRHKSGLYSVQKPLLIGAVLAGANKKQREILIQVGDNLGLAFQMKDDILGVFGEQKLIGKSVISDIREGKRTLLIVKTWEKISDKKSKKQFLQILGKKDLSQKEISWIKKMMESTGALNYCQGKCIELVEQAKMMLENEKLNMEARLFLLELADFIILRKY